MIASTPLRYLLRDEVVNLLFGKEDAEHNVLYALKLDSRSALRSPLEQHIQTVDWDSLNIMEFALGDQLEALAHQYVGTLDRGLRLAASGHPACSR